MGLMFYARGRSAQVAPYLSGALFQSGWEFVLASGGSARPESGRTPPASSRAAGRSGGLPPALERFERGKDELAGPIPFHGWFEDRGEAPDPVFAALGPEQAELQVSAWEGVLEGAGFGDADVISFVT